MRYNLLVHRTLTTLLFILILTSAAYTPHAEALERFDVITTAQLKDLLELRSRGLTDFTLVNTLDALIASHHSIPGSINLPWSKAEKDTSLLGDKKDKLIITYCMGYR